MSSEKEIYSNIAFSREIVSDDFYTFGDVEKLREKCEQFKSKVMKCRTLGILSSINGRFYLRDMDLPLHNTHNTIRVSMVYIKVPLRSMIMSQTVQIFGTLQWKNEPVIFASIVQLLNTSMAVKLNETINSIAHEHFAKNFKEDNQDEY